MTDNYISNDKNIECLEKNLSDLKSELKKEYTLNRDLENQIKSLNIQINKEKNELIKELNRLKRKEIEYNKIIQSTSWKVTAPFRFIIDKTIKRKRSKSTNSSVKSKELKKSLQSDSKTLHWKLWAGFSKYAVQELLEIKNNENLPIKERVRAMSILAKKYYDEQDYERALKEYIEMDELNPINKRGLARIIPQVELYDKLGVGFKGKDLLWNGIENLGLDSNLCLGMAHIAESDSEKLKWINLVYEKHRLFPIKKINDNEDLTLNNIQGDMPNKLDTDLSDLSNYKISIIIPAYNAEDLIHIPIKSLLNQTFKNIEIIVVDDYSSDSTVEVVEQLAKSDSRIKLIRKEKNEGAYAARNTGLKYVTGDFITVHDSDDWSHPQKLEIQLRSILVNENIVGSLSNLIRTDYNVTPINRGSQLSDQYIMYNTSSLLLKKEVFEKLGEWDSVRVGADTEFHWRILKYFGDNSIINVGKTIPLSLCLSVTNSLTKTSETSVKTAKFGLRRIYREAASWWHNSQDFKRDPKITSESNRKFPSPMQNLSKNPKHEYDVILIDDFTSYSDQQLSIKLIKKFSDEGRKIAIFHYPYYRKNALEPIHDKVFDLIFKQNINIIVPTEKVNTEKLILCSSHLYDYILDQVPSINISREPIIIVDNINSEKNEKRSATIKKLFNSAPIWVNKHEIDKL